MVKYIFVKNDYLIEKRIKCWYLMCECRKNMNKVQIKVNKLIKANSNYWLLHDMYINKIYRNSKDLKFYLFEFRDSN